jgi:hypothetical protein
MFLRTAADDGKVRGKLQVVIRASMPWFFQPGSKPFGFRLGFNLDDDEAS